MGCHNDNVVEKTLYLNQEYAQASVTDVELLQGAKKKKNSSISKLCRTRRGWVKPSLAYVRYVFCAFGHL
jgi:hypothetical protein